MCLQGFELKAYGDPVKEDPSVYFKVPEGAKTVLNDIARDEEENFQLMLMSKEQLTHDTVRLEYGFDEDWYFGLPVGGHVMFEIKSDGGDTVARKYTPVSPISQKGYVSFVIKIYGKTKDHPDGGQLTQQLAQMAEGDF